MAVRTSAGTTLKVLATLPALVAGDYDQAGLVGLTWGTGTTNLVGEITDMGEIGGREYNVVTHLPMGARRAQKVKGSYNSGTMQIQLGRDFSDAGQTTLRAALKSDLDYSFRVTFQDGTNAYFAGKVTSLKTNIGGADQVTGLTMTVEINSDIFEV